MLFTMKANDSMNVICTFCAHCALEAPVGQGIPMFTIKENPSWIRGNILRDVKFKKIFIISQIHLRENVKNFFYLKVK